MAQTPRLISIIQLFIVSESHWTCKSRSALDTEDTLYMKEFSSIASFTSALYIIIL